MSTRNSDRSRTAAPRTYPIVVKTPGGLESVTAAELAGIGVTRTRISDRAVLFDGTLADIYRCNFRLRTALRILRGIASFQAAGEAELYKRLRAIPWERLFSNRQTFAIDCNAHSSLFRDPGYAARKAKDAIVDRFRETTGRRPSVDTRSPSIRIDLHIHNNRCDVALDASGESLHRRGYRTDAGAAPLSEVLAAGMLSLAGWDGSRALVDPFCGSGTIAIEAACAMAGVSPGAVRVANGLRYAFMNWPDFDARLWEDIAGQGTRGNPEVRRREHHSQYNHPQQGRSPHNYSGIPPSNHPGGEVPPASGISASDIDPALREVARANARRAGVERYINFTSGDFRGVRPPRGAVVVTNPPYGERLSEPDISDLYRSIGEHFKAELHEGDLWLLSGNFSALKRIGLRSSARIALFNGPIECRFVHYQFGGAVRADASAGGPGGEGQNAKAPDPREKPIQPDQREPRRERPRRAGANDRKRNRSSGRSRNGRD